MVSLGRLLLAAFFWLLFFAVDKRVTRPWVREPTTRHVKNYYEDWLSPQKPKHGLQNTTLYFSAGPSLIAAFQIHSL